MKIVDKSEQYPDMTDAELVEELVRLDEALASAQALDTGTGAIEIIITKAKTELSSRGVEEAKIKQRAL